MGKSGIIKDFVLPQEIYIGCRQQETVAENNNNRMLHNKKENEMYADLDEISVSEYAEILLQKYPELKDNYTYKKDFYTDLVSYLDHGFMIMQPRNPYLENMRIQRQKGCLYVCGVKFETPIDKMRTSVNAGNNILCPHEPEAPKELDGGNFLVKVVIPSRLKNVIMKQLEEKGITKEALLPM